MMGAVESALGTSTDELLRAQYRQGRSAGSLGQTLRQGVRIGLTPDNAKKLATAVGLADRGEDLANLAASLATVDDVSSREQRAVLARYELVADQRITAALALAEEGLRSVGSVVGCSAVCWLGVGRVPAASCRIYG